MIWHDLQPGADAMEWLDTTPAPPSAEELRCSSILRISPNADAQTVHDAYRRMACRYHPDISTDEDERLYAEARMRELNAAYNTLRSRGRT